MERNDYWCAYTVGLAVIALDRKNGGTLVPQKSEFLRHQETSVIENHWSPRSKNN
jgi:hypothetical protein